MPHQRFPKIEILSLFPHELRFILSDTDVSVANSLRRIMIAEVPTLAIDLVEFQENSTVLDEEYIAHRLGLIPIRFQARDNNRGNDCSGHFISHRECTCDNGCNRCNVEFMLDVDFDVANKGRPESEQMLPITVTSKDLVSNNEFVMAAHFLNVEEQEEAHDEGISIVKLGPGQKLRFTATARMGISKEHAKWCPVAVSTYRFWPIITINEEQMATLSMEQKQELVDVCPDRVLELDEVTGQVRAVENAVEVATFTEDIMYKQRSLKRRPEDEDFVTITQSTNRFIFTVESTGAMDCEDILMSSLKVLKNKLYNLAEEVDKLKDM